MRKLSNDELNRLSPEEFAQHEKLPIVVVLENVRSALNVGAVFRSCDAFNIEKIILIGYTATPPNKEIHKTALGATDTVNWEYAADSTCIHALKNEGYTLYSVEQAENAVMLNDLKVKKNEKIAFVFGNEVMGVEQETINMSHHCLEIPQYGTKHSLNVSVCAGVVLWHTVFLKMNTK